MRAFISHTSSIIRLTVTTNRRKSQQGKHVLSMVTYLMKYVLGMVLYLGNQTTFLLQNQS